MWDNLKGKDKVMANVMIKGLIYNWLNQSIVKQKPNQSNMISKGNLYVLSIQNTLAVTCTCR